MKRLLSISLSTVLVAACGNNSVVPPPKDMAMTGGNKDMTGGGMDDMSVAMGGDMATQSATIHDIDTDAITKGTSVTLTGVVVTGVAFVKGVAKKSMKCEYEAYVQDPNGAAPSGIVLFATGPVCSTPDGGTKCLCPFPPSSGTPLDALPDSTSLGDEYTIAGTVDTFNPTTDAGLLPTQHSLNVTSLTKTGSGKTITPYVPTATTDFAANGAGYQMYEDMVVDIQPAQPAMTSAVNTTNGTFTYAGAQFHDGYRFFYNMGLDGGSLPDPTVSYKSITGVADPAFGGEIKPRIAADFQK